MNTLSDFVVRLHCPKKRCNDTYHSITDIDYSCKDCEEDKSVADIYEKGNTSDYMFHCICGGDEDTDACCSENFETSQLRKTCDICKGDYDVFTMYKLHAE